ncbi:MAG: hypothetical protein RLZZ350_201 [Verrucomicrobiota bacterium]|jgi:chromosome segregation ATPase
MSTEHDATEFVDDDFQSAPHPAPAAPHWAGSSIAAPTRAEVDSQVTDAQTKLADLKRQQEELERQRASLEDLRRRQTEFQTGREEMLQQLTRGVGLLEESELAARREAELAAQTLAEFKSALDKLKAINEQAWTKDALSLELTRALTTIENARMEWNSARVKLPVLNGESDTRLLTQPTAHGAASLAELSFGQLCKLGLAFTLPLLLAVLALAFVLLARK